MEQSQTWINPRSGEEKISYRENCEPKALPGSSPPQPMLGSLPTALSNASTRGFRSKGDLAEDAQWRHTAEIKSLLGLGFLYLSMKLSLAHVFLQIISKEKIP